MKILHRFMVAALMLVAIPVSASAQSHYAALSSPLGHEIVELDDTTGELSRWCFNTSSYCEVLTGAYSDIDAQGNQMCALRDDAHVICWKKTLGGFKDRDLGVAPLGADFVDIAVGRNFVVGMNEHLEVFFRFFTDSGWTQYAPGSTFEHKLEAGLNWFCVASGGVFPWTTECVEPSTGASEQISSYMDTFSGPGMDDADYVYIYMPYAYTPNTPVVQKKELGGINSTDISLSVGAIDLPAGGDSFCAVFGVIECFGQLSGFHATSDHYIVTGFRGSDVLILINGGIPTIVQP